MSFSLVTLYSRLLVRYHWLVLGSIIVICIGLTVSSIFFTPFPDFSDPRIGWGARGKGTIFSQLMVLRHASERFRLAYEIPLEKNDLFGAFEQFVNVTVDALDEDSYRSDLLTKYDLWRKKGTNEDDDGLIDYQTLDETFYDQDATDHDSPEYHDDEHSQSASIYQWHGEQHFSVNSLITKYVDDKVINITVMDFVKNLPQFNTNNYKVNRLPFEMLQHYAYLLEEKYRGRSGRDGMIEFYFEPINAQDDLLSVDHLRSICSWETKYKDVLSLNDVPSLSLATFVALYARKNDCHSLTADDVEQFRTILRMCLPYYLNGYMDVSFSDVFLNRVTILREPGHSTYQEQVKAVYTALRHTCFYKNVTRFIFDHFVDKKFINNLQSSNWSTNAKVSISMIFISNYHVIKYNRTRDQTMCLRRRPHSTQYCEERGCTNDYRNHFMVKSCANETFSLKDCKEYCECKHHCPNETESVVLLSPILKASELIDIFVKNFSDKEKLSAYQDKYIKMIAMNFANAREKAAMSQIYKDMRYVIMAALLIICITVCYLRSTLIASMIVVGAALSLGVSYFIYRTIYRIPIFPFMNLMSAYILIGIGCDDIFVLFDTWDQEKIEWLRKYFEKQNTENTENLLNDTNSHEVVPSNKKVKPSKLKRPSNAFQSRHHLSLMQDPKLIRQLLLTEDALTDILSNTLRHAGASMFVTSFTTAAAFYTNMLTNISFVQVFGVFTGTCILIYFAITVTAIAAFAIIYERHIRNIASRLFSMSCTNTADTLSTIKIAKLFDSFGKACTNFRAHIFEELLPSLVITLRYVTVVIFFLMGVLGLIGIFYYPQLKVPSTQKVAFFLKDNPMEVYEFSMKNQFNGYAKEDKRMFAYPAVSFVFGINDIDDGYIFDMEDRGHLYLTPIYLHRRVTLNFFRRFIAYLGTLGDLFYSNYDLQRDFESFYELTSDNILVAKVIDDLVKSNISQTSHLEMIKYLRQVDPNLLHVLINNTVLPNNYKASNDHSNRDDYMDKSQDQINISIYTLSKNQLIRKPNPRIRYSNYRKLFNKTLEKLYKQQIERNIDHDAIRHSLNDTTRDKLSEEYQNSALKTALQCLTGAAGATNVPSDFCEKHLGKRRSFNWAVLPDKPSSIDGSIRPFSVIITLRGNHNRTDYSSYNEYYGKVKNAFDPFIKTHAPEHLKNAWFSSSGFAFYGLQRELLVGSYTSLLASLGIALLVLFLTSGNLFIAIYALITITLAIAVTVGIFSVLRWELAVVEAIIVIMSVGLSVDFVVHFGVGYIHTDLKDIAVEREKVKNRYLSKELSSGDKQPKYRISSWRLAYKEQQIERETRVTESISRVGSAVFMAAFTTFAAGFSMTFTSIGAFRQMGYFLMTIMSTSWGFAMFFFLPLCAIIGPTGQCGSIPFSRITHCCKRNQSENQNNTDQI